MVTETNETLTQMFDSMTSASKACVDAGQRFQESWFAKAGQGRKGGSRPIAGMFDQCDNMTRAWFPFFSDTAALVTECAIGCADTNAKAIKTSIEENIGTNDDAWGCKPKELWDSAFDAAQANFDAVNKTGRRAMENWTEFCKTVCDELGSGKPSNKNNKNSKEHK